jgi:PAS domain S-box-containing protein
MQMAASELPTDVHGKSWFAAAFDAVPAAMMVVDELGRIVFSNPEAGRTFRKTRDELEGMLLETLIACDDRGSMHDALAGVLGAPNASARRDLSGVDSTGRRIELSFGRLETGKPLAVVVIGITGEPRVALPPSEASAALDARDRLEAMLDCAPAFIIALSRRGTLDFINRTLPHHSRADVIGVHWHAFFAPDQRVVMEAKFQAMYETEAVQIFETATPGPHGEPVWFETQIAPIRRAGEIVGAVLVSQDVTERKRTQAELLSSRHMALLGTLAAGIAHEINTPIQFVGDSIQFLSDATTALLGLIGTLQGLHNAAADGQPLAAMVDAARGAEEEVDLAYLRESLPPAFERCIGGLDQISRIVHSLKDFAHPSDTRKAPADLNRIVENAVTIARNEYKFVATVDLQLGDLPPITCHAAEIMQVVLNLVVNAAHTIGEVVKGSERKGLITVATRYEGDTAVITVGDTGTGIPEAIRSRVFDPFFTTKKVGKGTGQGLSIAWSMVKERHGGELTFDTEMGKGTTFTVRIPNTDSTATEA